MAEQLPEEDDRALAAGARRPPEQARNPYLPGAPADAQHQFADGPTDLGGNRRCTLCGAYRGSDEAGRPCKGEYAESGKMRSWAEKEWARDKARRTGP